MNKLIRWYNQNREQFIVVIIAIAFVIILIQVLNSIAARQNEKKRNEYENLISSGDNSNISNRDKESVITGEKVPEEDTKQNKNLIKTFIDYCNNNQIENAYNMLTEECRENIFPNIQSFKTNYRDRIFDTYKMYNLENWYNYQEWCTYYIQYIDDILATGNINQEDAKGDYITIVKEDTDYKINISGYIGRKKIEGKAASSNIEVTVNWIDMYIDNSILNISVRNNTENLICLDTKKDLNTMYLYDSNGVKYGAFLNEIADERLEINKDITKTLNIKFNKMYNPERKLKWLKMSDIVLNYANYKKGLEEKKTLAIDVEI